MNPQYLQQSIRPPSSHGSYDYAMSDPGQPAGFSAQNGPPPSPQQFSTGPPTGIAQPISNLNLSEGKPQPMGPPTYFSPSGPPSRTSNVNYHNGASMAAPPVQQPYPSRLQGPVSNPAYPQQLPEQQQKQQQQQQQYQQHQNSAPPMPGGQQGMQAFRPMMGAHQPQPIAPPRMPTHLAQQMNNLSLGGQHPPAPPPAGSGPAIPQHVPQSMQAPPVSLSSQPNYGPTPLGQHLPPAASSQYPNQSPAPSAGYFPPGAHFHGGGGPAPNGMLRPSVASTHVQPQSLQRQPGSSSTGQSFPQPRFPYSHPTNSMGMAPPNEPPLAGATPTSHVSPNAPPQFDSMNGVGLPASAMSLPPPPLAQQFNMGPTPPPLGNNAAPPASPYGSTMQPRYPGPMNTGLPPHPGMNQNLNRLPQQAPGMAPGHMPQPQPQQQQQQQRRLDPDMMPSPIQVIEDNRKDREGVFCTNIRGQVPPLVTTNFVTQDQGNCNPRFMRSSMYTVPCTPDMMKQTAIPFTITISPFAKLANEEQPPPIVQFGDSGPVRCIRCKAYMCPFMQFIDGGRRFQCSFCRATTEVPAEYFAHLDHTGQRVDKYERAELCFGSYEFMATKDYCKNNAYPLPPAFIFVIDVSYNNVKSGVVQQLCENMKSILASLPSEDNETQVKVGFITYSSSVQFYNLNSCLAQPQVMVVPDVQDMFMPLLDGFLVGLQESETLIDLLLEQIPLMYEDNRETETILGPAIKAGLEALKAADRSGKLFVFHSSLPIADAPGKLKNRDDRKLLGTDKEKTVLAPQNTFYNQLGQDCVTAGCSVDLFTFPNAYIDIATIGQVCSLTGGQLHKYTYFVRDVDGSRFIEDLRRTVSQQVAFDAVMRVRTSTGIRPTDFFGNYFMSNTTDVELAAVDTSKAICIEIKHDDKLADEDAIYIQTAVLYTSVGGQRRLRIHNLSLNTCNQMADLYRNCELDALMNYFSKACLRQLCEQTPKQVKETLLNKCAQSLACYRKNCASPSSAGQLILPECMKLLPLYVNCLLKSDAIAGGSDMTTDDRSFAMQLLNSMDIYTSLGYIYPRLIPLHNLDPNSDILPTALRCTAEKLRENGAYLLENGIYMFVWVGMNMESEWMQNVFGVQSAAQIDIDKSSILDLDNPISRGVNRVIRQIREERQRYMKMFIIRQRDKLETVFRHFLVEDKGIDGTPSYIDFLCNVHREIRNLLS